MKYICCHIILLLCSYTVHAQLHGNLSMGKYHVGFKMIDEKINGAPFRICVWYPAEKKNNPMKLGDYVDIASLGGMDDKAGLRSELKNVLEMVFDMNAGSIPQDVFDAALNSNVWAVKDAPISKGKFPLVLVDAEPSVLVATTEWLASNGYVVALPALQYPAPANDNTLYEGPTNGLKTLLGYIGRQAYVDTTRISLFGFGGGALAAFYVAMQSNNIRSMVNVEGGLFMPATKTTLSTDYKPAQFNIPLLHVTNPYITANENKQEFDAIRSTKYQLTEQVRLQHHDFTLYGRIINSLTNIRGEAATTATEAFGELHQYILTFLQKDILSREDVERSKYFKLDVVK